MKRKLFFSVFLILGCIGLKAQSNADGSYNIPVYVTNSTNYAPEYYTIYVGISGVDNGSLLPYMFDTGSPNFFSTAGTDGNTNPTTNGFFNFSGNGSPGYFYQTLSNTISLGDSNQTTYASTASNVEWAQIRVISNAPPAIPPIYVYPSNSIVPDRGGVYGNFGAGLYGSSTLATVLTQLPLASGLKQGYSMNFTTNLTLQGAGSLTLGLSSQLLNTLSNMPGAIILSLLPSGTNLPTSDGTTPGYQRAQVSNVVVNLTSANGSTITTNMPFVLDTGGGRAQIIYDTNPMLTPFNNATEVTVSSAAQTIYSITNGLTAWNGGVSVNQDNPNGTRINSGGYFFGSNIVTFDLTDGIVIINPVPEPASAWLAIIGSSILLCLRLLYSKRKN